ncbi:restriction endonuclease [Anatilimnocola floriformis]|uniref:restriction endonuclease n=1 Tax=Anatilimnocola floriformis TaxID=2948575 RepID=UPI0020C57EF5|nr:restriction endonuclease [Anatilimnocola floriformis]
MIDFKELPADGTSFEQFVREICLIYDLHPQWTGKGPDHGRDILATEKAHGVVGDFARRWLIQCKHYAHSGKSVGREDLGSIIDDCRQAGAEGFLLACSTQPSSALVIKLRELAEKPENRLVTAIWDGVDLEKRLAEPRCFSLGHLFFPRSFAATPWKLYNAGAPNKWTAHYKTYFLHLSSRIAGKYPNLSECEYIISRLESIKPKAEHEVIRPRAIYFDDKHDQFKVFADYLVPRDTMPSLLPDAFESALHDGYGLHSDGTGMWYITYWDIKLRRILPYSDHFDRDHYDYYNPVRGNFETGISRNSYTIGELAEYGNRWD